MEPKTLQEAVEYFASEKNCREYLVARRWPGGKVTCPRCGSENVRFSDKYNRWQCGSHHERRQFTLKTGTVFEESPVGLDKWLTALWMLVNCRNGVSSWEIHRTIGVTQKTAWFMLHRLRLAMQGRSTVKLGGSGGEVEADETFIGGKARNMHKDVRMRRIRGQGFNVEDKATVMGILERGGTVRAQVVPDRKKETLQPLVRKHVTSGSALFTDELVGYQGLDGEYRHRIVDHATRYVDGNVHTNGMENFWSLLKRGLNGTYVAVEPFHLFRYLDEQMFRFNNRKEGNKKVTDAERFSMALSQVAGKRLTYAELTGKVGEIEAS